MIFPAHPPLSFLLELSPCFLCSAVPFPLSGPLAWARTVRTGARTWARISMLRPALLPVAPELVEHWPWAVGGLGIDYEWMGQQRGVAREDFSEVMFKRSPK